jgi:hypothetical protein
MHGACLQQWEFHQQDQPQVFHLPQQPRHSPVRRSLNKEFMLV